MKTKRDSNRKQARRMAQALRHVLNELRQAVGKETTVVSFEATVAVPRRKGPTRWETSERASQSRPNIRRTSVNRFDRVNESCNEFRL